MTTWRHRSIQIQCITRKSETFVLYILYLIFPFMGILSLRCFFFAFCFWKLLIVKWKIRGRYDKNVSLGKSEKFPPKKYYEDYRWKYSKSWTKIDGRRKWIGLRASTKKWMKQITKHSKVANNGLWKMGH